MRRGPDVRRLALTTLVTGMCAAGPAGAAGPEAPGGPALTVVALGDSLTSGHRLPRQQAYPAVLETALQAEGLPVTVMNHGLSGDTTAGGLRRLGRALEERPHLLILALGANDALRGVPVGQVRANLERIIESAQAQGAAVLLVGMEALPLYGWQYSIDFHHLFRELAAKYRVPLVPFMLQGVFGNPDLTSDGLHPNAAGASLVAATILPYVRPLTESLLAEVSTPRSP